MKIKTSIAAIVAIILAFLMPIIPLILIVGVVICVDTIFGILKAKRFKETITSKKMSRLISKMVLYQSAIIMFFCIEHFILADIIGLFTSIPLILTKLVAVTLLFIEGTSINENIEALTGVSMWSRFKSMLNRGKELKSEIEVFNNKTIYPNIDDRVNHTD